MWRRVAEVKRQSGGPCGSSHAVKRDGDGKRRRRWMLPNKKMREMMMMAVEVIDGKMGVCVEWWKIEIKTSEEEDQRQMMMRQ